MQKESTPQEQKVFKIPSGVFPTLGYPTQQSRDTLSSPVATLEQVQAAWEDASKKLLEKITDQTIINSLHPIQVLYHNPITKEYVAFTRNNLYFQDGIIDEEIVQNSDARSIEPPDTSANKPQIFCFMLTNMSEDAFTRLLTEKTLSLFEQPVPQIDTTTPRDNSTIREADIIKSSLPKELESASLCGYILFELSENILQELQNAVFSYNDEITLQHAEQLHNFLKRCNAYQITSDNKSQNGSKYTYLPSFDNQTQIDDFKNDDKSTNKLKFSVLKRSYSVVCDKNAIIAQKANSQQIHSSDAASSDSNTSASQQPAKFQLTKAKVFCIYALALIILGLICEYKHKSISKLWLKYYKSN